MECDFDRNPTNLHLAIQQRDWLGVKYQVRHFPKEVRTKVVRKDEKGILLWRLLPIHAAILNEAPDDILQLLLTSYQDGAKSQDDHGMLPIHLAIKKHRPSETINLLLSAYPDCINVQNYHGLTPHQQAETSSSEHKKYYLRALKRGPTYSAVTGSMSDLLCGVSFPSLSEIDPRTTCTSIMN